MISIDVKTTCRQEAREADFQVSLTSPGGTTGIESITVKSVDGAVVTKQTQQDCPPSFQFAFGPVTDLPVYVWVTECQAGEDQGQTLKETKSFGPCDGESAPRPLAHSDAHRLQQHQNTQQIDD